MQYRAFQLNVLGDILHSTSSNRSYFVFQENDQMEQYCLNENKQETFPMVAGWHFEAIGENIAFQLSHV